MKRLRLAAPILLVYWLMLAGGLALYAAIRIDDTPLQSLWLGAIAGTVLGHGLALLDMRGALAGILVFLTTCWLNAVLPSEMVDKHLWMAFVPGAMCAFWSLGDRAALAAFWFPAVIWMLSILDRTGARAMPDQSGVILLGGLAVMFIVFLRIREARRVRMWQTISAAPLADPRESTVLRETPGRHIARIAWVMSVGSIAFGVTAWLAPHLWQTESFGGGHVAVAPHLFGRPCCPVASEIEPPRARVKEYFDLGRGQDEPAPDPRVAMDCQICDGGGTVAGLDPVIPAPPSGGPVIEVPSGPYRAPYQYEPPPGPSYRSYSDTPGDRPQLGTDVPVPSPPVATPAPSTPGRQGYTPAAPPAAPSVALPAPAPSRPAPRRVAPPAPPPPPPVAPPHHEDPPPVTAAPAPAPPAPSTPPPPSSTETIEPRHDSSTGPSLLAWLALLVGAVLIVQLVALALRPARRWITLRHLRRPFWAETVDQRVSNAWQLALVGLRDAGWRSSSNEAPREFADRVGVAGLDRCATILERARHGLGIDAEDLAEMNRSADLAYHSARANLGTVARAASWLRWPLA